MSTAKERCLKDAMTYPAFDKVKELWNSASYHYADDSGGEWGAADTKMGEANQIMANNSWSDVMITRAHIAVAPLMSMQDIKGKYINFLVKERESAK